MAAVASKKITVLSYVLVATGAVTVKWRTASTDISGAMALAANGGVSAHSGDITIPLLQTATNEALNLNLSSAVQVSGHVTYYEA